MWSNTAYIASECTQLASPRLKPPYRKSPVHDPWNNVRAIFAHCKCSKNSWNGDSFSVQRSPQKLENGGGLNWTCHSSLFITTANDYSVISPDSLNKRHSFESRDPIYDKSGNGHRQASSVHLHGPWTSGMKRTWLDCSSVEDVCTYIRKAWMLFQRKINELST